MPFRIDIWSVFAIILVLAILYWLYRTIRSQYDEQRYHEELAALEFEHSIVESSVLSSEDDNRFSIRTNTEASLLMAATPLEAPPALSPTSAPAQHLPDAFAPIIDRLKAAGLFQNIEAHYDHNGIQRYTVLVKLKGNKLVLIVPDMESATFLRHQLKRCDAIILAPPGGESFVVHSMAGWLADSLASRVL